MPPLLCLDCAWHSDNAHESCQEGSPVHGTSTERMSWTGALYCQAKGVKQRAGFGAVTCDPGAEGSSTPNWSAGFTTFTRDDHPAFEDGSP